MKTKATLLIGTALIATFSCNTKNYTEQDRTLATQNLENYVDSVKNIVAMGPRHDWNRIENRFDSLENRAEKIYNDLEVEDNTLEMAEEEFEMIIENAKRDEENFERTAEMHMKNLNTWWETNFKNDGRNVKITTDNMDAETKESWNWLEANMEKLGDNIKNSYNRFKEDISKI
jgi:hypothetical protein